MHRTFEWTNEWPFRTVRNPVWASKTRDDIVATVRLYDEDEECSYLCSPTDCVSHSCELFRRAVAGEFGPIAEYEPPPAHVIEAEYARMVRSDRDAKLRATDWTQTADVPESTRETWRPYRQALRDVPQQDGFPMDVTWPERPQ